MKHRDQNSLIPALRGLASSLFLDLQQHHPLIAKELTHDYQRLENRLAHEGVSFLTQTLPTLSKALYSALETGFFHCPTGFRKKKGTALPRFTGGLLSGVINNDGSVKVDVDSSSLVDALQVYQMFYKLDLPYSPEKEKKVIESFKQTEFDLQRLEIKGDNYIDLAADLCRKVFKGFNPMDITPRHGPGAVATREKCEEKWEFKRKYKTIHKVFPYYDYFVPSRSSLLRRVHWYRSLEPRDHGTARVVLVPKDSRGPRLISMEPLEFQFVQQGLARPIMDQLERKSPYTRNLVNFTDQSINQNLALFNSCSRRYSTLDLKEASDRVSLQLVRKVFAKVPELLRCLEATRSQYTVLPDGSVMSLLKFAPMGSALCFPVEAFVFFVLAEAVRRKHGISGRVYVYGDDLIVPRELTRLLFDIFPIYGLMFNERKSFTNGYFRESCGMDAYKGIICTPIRMRKVLPMKRQPELIVSGVDFSNRLFERGYWNTADYVRKLIDQQADIRVLRSPKARFGGLAYSSFSQKGVYAAGKTRFEPNHQVFECLATTIRAKTRKEVNKRSDNRLFENLVNQRQETYIVPHAMQIKLRWCYLYG